MNSILIELHPGAMRQDNWRTRGRSSAHFWRGELAVSAGYHVMCQAIVILGIASRSRVATLRWMPEGNLEDFYFTSVLADQHMSLAQVVSTMDTFDNVLDVIANSGTRRQMLDQAIEGLADGAVCLLDLADHNHRCRLWILVVGIEFQFAGEKKTPTALMVLDCNERSVDVAAWNGRLELVSPPSQRRLHYRSMDGRIREVTLGNVVTMKRRAV